MGKGRELVGQKFGRLLVERKSEKKIHKERVWFCKCDCGNNYETTSYRLTSGAIKSCGCLRDEYQKSSKTLNKTHGETGTLTYRSWEAIKRRCLNENNKDFIRYGGRGITVCDEWINSYEQFHLDMGDRPSEKHSIDRVDNNLGYSKENCRWATQKEQTKNRCSNRVFTINGETKNLTDWCATYGVNFDLVRSRIDRGMDIEPALSTPSGMRVYKSGEAHKNAKLTNEMVLFIRSNYKIIPRDELAKIAGVSKWTIRDVQENKTYKDV